MGVILCTFPNGPAAVVVSPKCGSTSLRTMLDPWRDRQAEKRGLSPDEGWLTDAYRAQHIERSWGVVRNPWKRILSRWREKGGRIPFPSYVKGFVNSQSVMGMQQTEILGQKQPLRLVDIDAIDKWIGEFSAMAGVTIVPEHARRGSGTYDWKAIYREHPEARDLVREMYPDDWSLGFDWEDPLA